jgi:hypothetical protein
VPLAHPVAPHVPVVLQLAVQQLPVPVVPQIADEHWRFAVHALPAASLFTHVPLAPGLRQNVVFDKQSASLAQAVLHDVLSAQTNPPAQGTGAAAPQVPEPSQVPAEVIDPAVHEAAPQDVVFGA